MSIKYHEDEILKRKVEKIVQVLNLNHVDLDRVFCVRSHKSSSRNVVARCHTISKIIQQCLCIKPAYVIEVISEVFERMSEEEQERVLLHEIMHIPKTFGGGFRHHDFVSSKNVNKIFKEYLKRKDNSILYSDLGDLKEDNLESEKNEHKGFFEL